MTKYTGRLQEIYVNLSEPEQDLFNEHFLGGSSAAWLANELTRAGHKISATTLKEQRQRVNSQ